MRLLWPLLFNGKAVTSTIGRFKQVKGLKFKHEYVQDLSHSSLVWPGRYITIM